jgi:hypothetical protein
MEESVPIGKPIIKFALLKCNPTQSSLVIRFSHAQYDGISLPLFCDTISALYQENPVLQTPSFSSYVCKCAARSNAEAFDFWKMLLKDSSMACFPLQLHSSNNPASTPGTDIIIRGTVQLGNQRPGITAATIVKAAYSMVLARRNKLTDVVFGQIVSGRAITSMESENIVGPQIVGVSREQSLSFELLLFDVSLFFT